MLRRVSLSSMGSRLTTDRFKLLAQLLAQLTQRLALRATSAAEYAACKSFVFRSRLVGGRTMLLEEVEKAVFIAA